MNPSVTKEFLQNDGQQNRACELGWSLRQQQSDNYFFCIAVFAEGQLFPGGI